MFIEGPVRIASPLGDLELGVVDAEVPGVAEGVSRLLMRSIQDARAEVGGHLPSWLVDDIERNYISPEKVRTLWAPTGHRFVLRLGDEIVGTIHIAKSETMILTVDRHILNVEEREHPGFKPPRHHHVVNISVKHELRRAKLGTLMVDGILAHFRHLFAGVGLWVRADPPWHPGLAGLGFVHDPARDVFLPASVERTAGVPHPEFNQRYACACGVRRPEMDTHKLQYVSMTRPFESAATAPRPVRDPEITRGAAIRPASIEEVSDVLAWASREGRRVKIRGQGQSYDDVPGGDELVLSTERLTGVLEIERERVTVFGGTTWRTLLGALTPRDEVRFPPVVPSWIESSIGGSLAYGGIGKGSLHGGFVIDHLESLVVVTGDGRIIACSAKQAGWLFAAVCGGQGRFGVIARATLRLAEAPRFIERECREVDAHEVAGVMADPMLLHASAIPHGSRFRVFVTHRGAHERGEPIAQWLVPRPSSPGRHRLVSRIVLAAELGAVLERARDTMKPDDEVWTHAFRRHGELRFLVQHLRTEGRSSVSPLVDAPPSDTAKRLADPHGILP
jgi:hypothetical protein